MVFFSLLLIASMVSLDAFFTGFAVGVKNKYRFLYIFYSTIVVFGMCMASYFVSKYLVHNMPFNLSLIGGILFIFLGLKSVIEEIIAIKKKKDKPLVTIKDSFAYGFTLGLDGSFALFTLKPCMLIFTAPVLIIFMHFLLFNAGWIFSSKFIKLDKLSWLSGIMLIMLGLLKVFEIF